MVSRRQVLQHALRGAIGIAAMRKWLTPSGFVAAASPPPIQYDSDGLIVHRGMDGGDTAQREGWYWFGAWMREKVMDDPWPVTRTLTFPQVVALLEPKADGIFHRHPKLPPWNNPYDKQFGFSRDQMVPLVAAMGVWGLHDPLRRLWNALPQDVIGGAKHTFNGEWLTFLGQKTVHTGDLVGPMTINLFRRAWNEDPMAAGDGNGPGGEQELRANVLLRLRLAQDRDDTGDDLNLIAMLLMALLKFPSGVANEAANLYAKNRPVSYGSFLGAYRKKYGVDLAAGPDEVRRRMDDGIDNGGWQTDASRVFGAPRWYHREEAGANPQLADLYEPIIRKYLE